MPPSSTTAGFRVQIAPTTCSGTRTYSLSLISPSPCRNSPAITSDTGDRCLDKTTRPPGQQEVCRREGIVFAWESADTGDEVTPEWTSSSSGPPSRIWTGEIEEHITSDVAYAAFNYWRWTGDDKFMRDEGIEMIVEEPGTGLAVFRSSPAALTFAEWSARMNTQSCRRLLLHNLLAA